MCIGLHDKKAFWDAAAVRDSLIILALPAFVVNRNFTCFFEFFKERKRRRWDLNPRAAVNDLLPFQGSPFGLLGTSPNP